VADDGFGTGMEAAPQDPRFPDTPSAKEVACHGAAAQPARLDFSPGGEGGGAWEEQIGPTFESSEIDRTVQWLQENQFRAGRQAPRMPEKGGRGRVKKMCFASGGRFGNRAPFVIFFSLMLCCTGRKKAADFFVVV
jgi:hypothetical protein